MQQMLASFVLLSGLVAVLFVPQFGFGGLIVWGLIVAVATSMLSLGQHR